MIYCLKGEAAFDRIYSLISYRTGNTKRISYEVNLSNGRSRKWSVFILSELLATVCANCQPLGCKLSGISECHHTATR